MKTFKKLTTSISATIESFVNEVENQEAIVEAIIKELRIEKSKLAVSINDSERVMIRATKRQSKIIEEIKTWENRIKENPEQEKCSCR